MPSTPSVSAISARVNQKRTGPRLRGERGRAGAGVAQPGAGYAGGSPYAGGP